MVKVSLPFNVGIVLFEHFRSGNDMLDVAALVHDGGHHRMVTAWIHSLAQKQTLRRIRDLLGVESGLLLLLMQIVLLTLLARSIEHAKEIVDLQIVQIERKLGLLLIFIRRRHRSCEFLVFGWLVQWC